MQLKNRGLLLDEMIDRAVKMLNDMLRLDPDAMNMAMRISIRCNSSMANHETVQVLMSGTPEKHTEEYKFSMLGIINGLVGYNTKDSFCGVAMYLDRDGRIERFGKIMNTRIVVKETGNDD